MTSCTSAAGRAISLYLFDIDGTILRGSTTVHREAFRHAYRTVYRRDALSLDGISAAGRTDRWLLAETLRQHGVDEDTISRAMPEAFAAMAAYVEANLPDLHEHVLPGVPEVLLGLRAEGATLGLLTGNLRAIAFAKMRAAGLAQFFSTGGFGEESEERPDLVPVALRESGNLLAQDAVIIGDTPLDVAAGRSAGAQTAGVATGPFSEDDLRMAGADLVLPSLADASRAVDLLLALTKAPGIVNL